MGVSFLLCPRQILRMNKNLNFFWNNELHLFFFRCVCHRNLCEDKKKILFRKRSSVNYIIYKGVGKMGYDHCLLYAG